MNEKINEIIENEAVDSSSVQIRSKIKGILQDLIRLDVSHLAVIRRDGVIIETLDKNSSSINWKGMSINASHVINYSETLSDEIYMGDFETSVLETDYQRIVLSKINSICFLLAILPKKANYTLEMLKISETVKKLKEILN
ncbi:MAG: hypothetical protein N3E37_04005 [Candidatus Micrarchaeota archaeon]|nr:hypothetical protein [Candidatus Micrarchaeota archaeon]